MHYLTTKQRRQIKALHEMGSLNYRQISEKVGCALSTVNYVLRNKTKKEKAEPDTKTPLGRFHIMEKVVNNFLKTPEEIFGKVEPPQLEKELTKLHYEARNALDLYVGTVGSVAFNTTAKQEGQTI